MNLARLNYGDTTGFKIVVSVYGFMHILLTCKMWCQGCQGGVVPLTGEHVVLLGVVRPLWSPPDTQLSPVAPRSCLHATAATPRATASTGRQNLVRVAEGSRCVYNHR